MGMAASLMHNPTMHTSSKVKVHITAYHATKFNSGAFSQKFPSTKLTQYTVGQIVFWQLTMGASYSTVEDVLQSLMKLVNKKMNMIDNCCMWRQKISDTFGMANMDVVIDKWKHKCMLRHPIVTNAVQ